MKMKHGWAAATLAVAVLSAAPGQAQGHSCDNGRGGLMTDLGFNNLRRGVRGNGPAAGRFRDGDVLAAVDEERITTHEGARRYSEIRGGEQMRLAVRRDGQVQEVTITAGARCIPHPPSPPQPPAPPLPPLPPTDELMPQGWFGFAIQCQNCGDDESTGAFRFREPPVVANVEPNSPAARAGLRPGDWLTHVDGVSLTSHAGWPQWYAIQPGLEVRLTYVRGGQTHQVKVSALPRGRHQEPHP